MNKILIIEDDEEINKILAEFLVEDGYEVVSLPYCLNIKEVFRKYQFDLILLDLMLPYKSGDQLLKEMRMESSVPVIVISAKGTTQNKIDLLRLGADDYITKPFDLEEVLARIESNLRRVNTSPVQNQVLRYHKLLLNPENNTVSVDGRELSLTAKEYGILQLLMHYPDKIFSKANLFQSVWGTEYLSEDNTLNVHISNLRNKLKEADSNAEYIDTVWGIGYRLHQEP